MLGDSYIAKRYAQSLFSSALEKKVEEKVLEELQALCESLRVEESFSKILFSVAVPSKVKFLCLNTVLDEIDFNEITSNFLQLLIRNNRFSVFVLTVEEYKKLLHIQKEEVLVDVKSSSNMDSKAIESISKQLSEVLSKKAIVNCIVDEKLIGGVVFNIGNMSLDCSIKKQLDEMKKMVLA